MKTLMVVVVVVAAAAFTLGTSVPPKPETVACEVQPESAEAGWLHNCHWCTCEDGFSVCKLQAACVNGEGQLPECSGKLWWMKDCNKCVCSSTGLALCNRKACLTRQ
ncbi:hypothetical protein O3P69_014830 [Scylla paramamosain]|uniref:Pacifastin domain-containing protein n=2 Tax=Scylla paramamosain TaxID=85552 RepID=A0AAW0U1K6_SCYPA